MDTTEASDIALLPTPERSRAPSTSIVRPPSPTGPNEAPLQQPFFILLPDLLDEEKKVYKAAAETSLKQNVEFLLDEVIGEYREGNVLYYYARSQGGLAHKFPSKPFLKPYQYLVDEFRRKDAAGELAPFDPSASYIHPSSRVRVTVRLRNRRAAGSSSARNIKSSSDVDTVPDSEEEDADEPESESDFQETDLAPARSSRRSRKQALPFSPRKTRSTHIYTIVSDGETGTSERNVSILSTRRSTRRAMRNQKKMNGGTDVDTDGAELSYGEDYIPRKASKKPKNLTRPKGSRPAYGHFRPVTDLEYDYDSDEETAPLRVHRDICEKCHQPPAHRLLLKLAKKGKGRSKKKRTEDDFEDSGDEEERVVSLGGWVRCLKCPVVRHWKCLASTQRDEILKAAREKDMAEWEANKIKDDDTLEPVKRRDLNLNQTTEFICGACIKGGFCMYCMETALEADDILKEKELPPTEAAEMKEVLSGNVSRSAENLLFRCLTCQRLAHYEHLPSPPAYSSDNTITDIAQYYTQTWQCNDCASYRFGVDRIIAWRPYPSTAVEPARDRGEPLNYKSSLPREYLVKWLDRSFRRVQWVPHMWLLSTHPSKLKNFLSGGSKVELMDSVDDMESDKDGLGANFEIGDDSRASSTKPGDGSASFPQDAIPDAERRIPAAWKTVDRLLDIFLWRSRSKKNRPNGNVRGKNKPKVIVASSDESENEFDEDVQEQRELAFVQGDQPTDDVLEAVSDWEARTGRTFNAENASLVAWAFIKWKDLGYDEANWDSPPRSTDATYSAFESALQRYVYSRSITIPKHTESYYQKYDKRDKAEYRNRHVLKDAADLDIGQDRQLKLMPFQGKTVQVATFLGNIAEKFKASPALVVVPNSTITNWVREFERWAPRLRVVPFYGEAKAREIIKKFELYHQSKRAHDTGAKFHVLIATYEALLNQKDFTRVFKNQPRWEVLVIDEGQRLKSDNSLLFRRLNELRSVQRVIMTGTPLNNNIRELFNLMNFLDPNEWSDLERLEKDHAELTEELVKELHNRLRPYFLRRLKSEVLQLPPKNEVIVPISMAPLQKEVYRSILSHNLELLNGLTKKNATSAPSKGRINNILMQLRKCLQHPYLYAEDIEPRGLLPKESHEKLIDASGKLRFLKSLLPKLKERGHRVLLFSQFVIALNVIEDFLAGEGLQYLRLDGNTKSKDRQKGMDEFNKPGSDIFIYILTTRAGGVGINLFSADTVIIYDPDFNPHQDLQAIARAYRFGQQKTCLVFKLMVKDSAEERIMQVGKKKLVLDHLIVQKMDDEDSAGEDVQSILTYGAQALFDKQETSREIIYSEQDIEKLVLKTEQEGDKQEQVKEGMSFAFAKVWAADKDSLEEVEDIDQGDSWAQTLQKLNEERDKVQVQETLQRGRGVKRRAAAMLSKPNAYLEGPPQDASRTPTPSKSVARRRGKSVASEGSGYIVSEVESDVHEDSSSGTEDETFEPNQHKSKKSSTPLVQPCGLCGERHGDGPGECTMIDRSENLAEFREMLLLHAEDESFEDRIAAIAAIDRALNQRGDLRLIVGQPLHPLRSTHHSSEVFSANQSYVPTAGPSVPTVAVSSNLPSGAMAQPAMVPPLAQPSRNPPPLIPRPLAAPKVTMPSSMMTPTPSAVTKTDRGNVSAVSSKRPASPTSIDEAKLKKKKAANSSIPCSVCEQASHLIKDCPMVTDGPQSIIRQIARLENKHDSRSASALPVLRQLLSKAQKKDSSKTNTQTIDLTE
ncbi:hypothetical protein H0H92_001374 [Tricholoma furcatifolium]|nr:hypothetical protein H0H92_001374 [Tricholoma furcatifolium]